MNVVTFETAKRLKEAGFPQKEEIYGPATILKLYNKDHSIAIVNQTTFYLYDITKMLFAPSATDILKELGAGIYSLELRPKNNGWTCVRWVLGQRNKEYNHENPAEACAAAWLAIHESKTTNQ